MPPFVILKTAGRMMMMMMPQNWNGAILGWKLQRLLEQAHWTTVRPFSRISLHVGSEFQSIRARLASFRTTRSKA